MLKQPVSFFRRAAVAVMATILLGTAMPLRAIIVGPYPVDGVTLHLWHVDSATTPVVDAAGGTNLGTLTNSATLGSPSYPGFGNALNTIDGGQDGTAGTNRDALLTASTSNPPGNVTYTYADLTTGAFTYEAIVWIGFDTSKNFGITNIGGNGRNTGCEIISCESGTTSNRIFQFRIMPNGAVTNLSGPIGPVLTFENVRGGSAAQSTIYAAIPTNGPDAIVSNAWYHAAVTYNGTPNTANNIKFYWTLLDPSRTNATQISITSPTTTLSGLNPVATYGTPLVVGNEARNRTANFLGLVDEVRMSRIERNESGMVFAPAPATIVTQPTNQIVGVGQPAGFVVQAGGALPIFYQWRLGGTNIPGATMDVNARNDGTLTLNGPQTLKGDGTFNVAGNVVNAGTIQLKLNKSGVTLTNDTLHVTGQITYGGTLALAISGNPPGTNDTFPLFSAAACAGTFASITPSSPGTGLAWDTNTSSLVAIWCFPVPAACRTPLTWS